MHKLRQITEKSIDFRIQQLDNATTIETQARGGCARHRLLGQTIAQQYLHPKEPAVPRSSYLVAALTFSSAFGLAFPVFATLQISTLNTATTIDFDSTVSGVNTGGWAGTGFQATPVAGQLDSDAWASTGMDFGSLAFGQTRTTDDYARGATSAPVTTGGFYSRTNTATARALWIQPTTDDFTPGTLTLRLQNTTGGTVDVWSVSYLLYVLNDQDRSNSFNLSYSTNNSTYTQVSDLNYTSPAAASGTSLVSNSMSTDITASIANNGFFYLRWSSADVGGSGSRDEFGLDNISISLAAVPEASAFVFGTLICTCVGMMYCGRRILARKLSDDDMNEAT